MLWNDGTMKVGVVGSWIGKSIAVDRNNRFPGILPCETRAAVAAATFASDDACWASLRETAKSEFVQWCAVVVKFILDRSFPARSLKVFPLLLFTRQKSPSWRGGHSATKIPIYRLESWKKSCAPTSTSPHYHSATSSKRSILVSIPGTTSTSYEYCS